MSGKIGTQLQALFALKTHSVDCRLWIPTLLLQQSKKLNTLSWFKEKNRKANSCHSNRKKKIKILEHISQSPVGPSFTATILDIKKETKILPSVEGHISPPASLLRHLMPIAWINRHFNRKYFLEQSLATAAFLSGDPLRCSIKQQIKYWWSSAGK